jgi:hypothetical protein
MKTILASRLAAVRTFHLKSNDLKRLRTVFPKCRKTKRSNPIRRAAVERGPSYPVLRMPHRTVRIKYIGQGIDTLLVELDIWGKQAKQRASRLTIRPSTSWNISRSTDQVYP